MLLKQVRFSIFIIVITSGSLFLYSQLGCKSRPAQFNNELGNNNVVKTSMAIVAEKKYFPLTEGNFNEIRNGGQNISLFNLEYETSTNEMDRLSFGFRCGNLRGNFAFPSINEFEGGLYKVTEIEGSFTEKTGKHNFTHSEVSNILDYISSTENRDYFFNGDEFIGKDIPYVSVLSYPDRKNYNLSIMYYKPETDLDNECWAIFKCVDEYPAEGTPLYGLFQMLENDFITQFEE